MQKTLQKRKDSGFTIIEVLIVLAIAGLIMVVVFLAVPALQRSGRNSQTKTEANNILSAYSDGVANNGGTALTAADETSVRTNANAKTITNLTIAAGAGAVTAPGTNATRTTYAIVRTAAKCTAQNSLTLAAGTTRQAALVYWIEDGSGTPQVQCIDA